MTHKHYLSLRTQMKIYSMIVHSKKRVLKIIAEFLNFLSTCILAIVELLI